MGNSVKREIKIMAKNRATEKQETTAPIDAGMVRPQNAVTGIVDNRRPNDVIQVEKDIIVEREDGRHIVAARAGTQVSRATIEQWGGEVPKGAKMAATPAENKAARPAESSKKDGNE
jgi:hypothetical protein